MTEIFFSFDTEDYTVDHASDAIRDEANLLAEYGIRGNFNIVGYVAQELVRHRRFDVLDALKRHTVSFHSLGHTLHPNICEYTDEEDYEAARRRLMREESEGIGMVKAATGVYDLTASNPPGNSFSYVAMYGYADLGLPLYTGSCFNTPDGAGFYFCNGFHTDYYEASLEYLFVERGSYDREALVERLAKRKRVVLYNHPNKVLYADFWDSVNYCRENKHPMGQWEEAPRRPDEDVALYYARLRELIETLRDDPRFTFGDMDAMKDMAVANMTGRRVTRAQLPAVREALKANFRWMHSPAELSVADAFYAAKHFLSSEEDYIPGFTHGFLEQPVGTAVPVTLTAQEVCALAAQSDPADFLPPSFSVNGKAVGPADLLFAMLDVALGAETVTVTPRPQQIDLDLVPAVRDLHLADTWMYAPTFRDRYLSDRLRLQLWTARAERMD